MTAAVDIPIQIEALSTNEVLVTGPAAICQWREANRIEVPGAEYIQKYVQRRWGRQSKLKTWAPGKWCRLRAHDVYEMRCSRGVLPRLLEALGYAPRHPAIPDATLAADVAAYIGGHPRWQALRDFQQAAFITVAEQRWGRIAFATNAGKGAVLALLADFAWRRGVPALILCDEKSVYDALLGELRTWAAVDPYQVKAGTQEIPPLGITLAMVQTLSRRLGEDPELWAPWLQQQGMLLLDEADKATAETWQTLCKAASATQWRAGFSGTFPPALSYDDWLLEDLMGPILLQTKNLEMVERGISAKPRVELRGFDVTRTLLRLPPWDTWVEMNGSARRLWTFEQAVMHNTARHAFIRSLLTPGVPTAIIVNRIEHGEQLQRAIPGSCFLDGAISEQHRITALDTFRQGQYDVLIVTKILDRGTNRLGFAQDVIFASGEGSSRQTLQRIGRGLRRADGKASLRLVDVIDRVDVAAHPDRKRLAKVAGFLHAAGQKRVELYRDEGFDVEVIA